MRLYLGLLKPVYKEVCCSYLHFHSEAFEFMMIFVLCEYMLLYFQTMHLLPFGLLSHLSPPLPFLKTKPKNHNRNKSPKLFSKWKQAHVGRESSKANQKKDGNDIHTIPTSCVILPCIQTTKLSTCTLPYPYSHPLKYTRCSALLTPHNKESIPAMSSSNTIS